MPVLNGFEAARRIRAFEGQERIGTGVLILAITGLGSDEAQMEAYKNGFDLFLLKPVRLRVLHETLEELGILGLRDK